MSTFLDLVEPRKRELFRIAAPLFAEHGYRGVTVRALASACDLSPAGLYHHFGSKAGMALFPILVRVGSAQTCRKLLRAASPDPVVRLRMLIDSGLDELPDFLLALRLAGECGRGARTEVALRSIFRDATSNFVLVAREAAPDLPAGRAAEFAQAAIAIFVGTSVPGFSRSGTALRGQLVGLAETYLAGAGVDRSRLEEALRGAPAA